MGPQQPLADVTIAKLDRAIEFIGAHFNQTPSQRTIATVAGMSHCRFNTVFKKRFGTTPKRYIDELRIRSAMEMLKRGDSFASTAEATGFADHSHFAIRFKQVFGKTPRQWLSQWKLQGNDSSTDAEALSLWVSGRAHDANGSGVASSGNQRPEVS